MTTATRTTASALAFPLVFALAACGGDAEMNQEDAEMDQQEAMVTSITISNAGFQTPESALYDAQADIYLVSNINGAPTDVDGNGFISRVDPAGAVETLKWIDGEAEGVTLSAPKGMAILGDTLYVADITAVRAFHRETGEPLGSWEVEGATFLNDLAASDDGTLYVSDSGLNPDFSSSGTDAVYRFEDGEPVVVAEGSALAGPNGLAVHGEQIIVASFGGAQAWAVSRADGEITAVAEFPGGSLDGVVVLDDGSLLVSSWETSAVYHVPVGSGEPVMVVDSVAAPADIGWDSRRSRVLIPLFNDNAVTARHVELPGEAADEQPRY